MNLPYRVQEHDPDIDKPDEWIDIGGYKDLSRAVSEAQENDKKNHGYGIKYRAVMIIEQVEWESENGDEARNALRGGRAE